LRRCGGERRIAGAVAHGVEVASPLFLLVLRRWGSGFSRHFVSS
jgi:hypothetical protein